MEKRAPEKDKTYNRQDRRDRINRKELLVEIELYRKELATTVTSLYSVSGNGARLTVRPHSASEN